MSIILFSAVTSFVIWLAWRKRTRWIINTIGRKNWYRNYYTLLPSWRIARQVKFFWSGRRCAKCGARFMLDIHHKDYDILGASILWWEWMLPFMLQVLCRSCHDKER